MNLKTRIKRIEAEIKVSEFCRCAGTRRFEIVYYENGKPATPPELLKGCPAPIPDFCETCGKPTNKSTIIVDFVESNIPKPEGAK